MTESSYDAENIFAKIVDGTVPANKFFETRATVAFLDAFPMVEGHALLVPKLKGFTSVLDMPPAKAAELTRDIQKVAKAVQKATGCSGVNIWSNCGADAGQSVFHPHFHIVPRNKDDKLVTYPPSAKEALTKEAAAPMLEKLEAALNPPKPLKKAKFGGVSSIKPDSKGLNLKLKVCADPTETTTKVGKFYEVLCGDSSGTVVLSLRDTQKDVATEGASIMLRNAAVKMVGGHIRLAVDKWGKVEAAEEPLDEEVEKAEGKNISGTEFELVAH
jgi:histidine triad (HIT) family protein